MHKSSSLFRNPVTDNTGGAAVLREFSLKHEDEKNMKGSQEDTLWIHKRLSQHVGEKQNS